MRLKRGVALLVLVGALSAQAHQGHNHKANLGNSKEQKALSDQPKIKFVYQQIQDEYLKSVQPIFEAKCAACHSEQHEAPWYAKVPGVSWLVESDRREAKEHLEISKGFPFTGHGSVDEDFEAIKEAVENDTMPTRLYRLVHPSSALTSSERDFILRWLNESIAELQTARAVKNL